MYNKMVDQAKNGDDVEYPECKGEGVAPRFQNSRCKCLNLETNMMQIKKDNPTSSPFEEDVARAVYTAFSSEATFSQLYTYYRS